MNDRLKHNLDRQLSVIAWTEADAHAVRSGMREDAHARRKLPAVLVLAVLLVLMVTAAVAATQSGLLGLIQRMQYPDLPADAQAYIQTDGVMLETEDFIVTIPEHYYDGRTLRTSVTVTPKEGKKLLYPIDKVTNRWQELIHMDANDADPEDTRTVMDMFSAFEEVHSVQLLSFCDGEYLQESSPHVYYTCDYAFDPETCALTFLVQARSEESLLQRKLTQKISIYRDNVGIPQKATHAIIMEANVKPEVYACTTPVLYPEAGVRINSLTLEVLPQDIYYTIDFTIPDWKGELYNRTNSPAIMFLFYKSIPEEGVAAEYLSSGLRSLHNMRWIDDEHSIATGVLSRSELSDTYYIAIRDFAQQKRLGVNAFHVHPVDAE
ncbi:MAG: hypothetical protein E7316_09190 [Clostridiales bacterium]|nr:hypothetical protein [Clostridiales bacterium]